MKTLLSNKEGGKFDKSKLSKYDRDFFDSKLNYEYKGKLSPADVHDKIRKKFSPKSKLRPSSNKNKNISARDIIEKVIDKNSCKFIYIKKSHFS